MICDERFMKFSGLRTFPNFYEVKGQAIIFQMAVEILDTATWNVSHIFRFDSAGETVAHTTIRKQFAMC